MLFPFGDDICYFSSGDDTSDEPEWDIIPPPHPKQIEHCYIHCKLVISNTVYRNKNVPYNKCAIYTYSLQNK